MKSKTKIWTAALAAAMVSIVLAVGGVGVGISRIKVRPEAIELSVIHADDAVERAWKLPAAASFRHEVSWQSNASLCGPSSLANVFRSLGEDATSETSVLADTRFTVSFTQSQADSIEKHCKQLEITIAEFIRHSVLKTLQEDIEKASEKASKPKPWSPVQEYNLNTPEPGAGFDETNNSWTPELITSYSEKVKARQRKLLE